MQWRLISRTVTGVLQESPGGIGSHNVGVRDGAEGKIQTNGVLTSHHHETKSERNNRKIIIGRAVKRSKRENRLRSREKSKRENLYRMSGLTLAKGKANRESTLTNGCALSKFHVGTQLTLKNLGERKRKTKSDPLQ